MIKSFKLFEYYQEVKSICKKYRIKDWNINPETGLDVEGSVDISGKELRTDPIKFGRVSGDFFCDGNQLTSLEGAPKSVGGDFYCSDNQIRDFLLPYTSLNESKKFLCEGNPIHEINKLFNDPKCIDIINEWGILDGRRIVRVRLEEVFLDMGLEVPERLKFKEWELV